MGIKMHRHLRRLGVMLTPWAWLSHIALGCCLQIAVAAFIYVGGIAARHMELEAAFVGEALWYGATASIFFWYGRKKFEHERWLACKAAAACEANIETVGPYWYLGWLPTSWLLTRQLELYAPSAANVVLAWLCPSFLV